MSAAINLQMLKSGSASTADYEKLLSQILEPSSWVTYFKSIGDDDFLVLCSTFYGLPYDEKDIERTQVFLDELQKRKAVTEKEIVATERKFQESHSDEFKLYQGINDTRRNLSLKMQEKKDKDEKRDRNIPDMHYASFFRDEKRLEQDLKRHIFECKETFPKKIQGIFAEVKAAYAKDHASTRVEELLGSAEQYSIILRIRTTRTIPTLERLLANAQEISRIEREIEMLQKELYKLEASRNKAIAENAKIRGIFYDLSNRLPAQLLSLNLFMQQFDELISNRQQIPHRPRALAFSS
ncbi:MAG: hypothetical protein M1561_04320 [Gammaproteobacteria bacterium]|nr:hypothetical protein [Gammaproteobacteria bacterium]